MEGIRDLSPFTHFTKSNMIFPSRLSHADVRAHTEVLAR